MNYILPGLILVAGILWIGMLLGSFFVKLVQSISLHQKSKRKRRMTEMAQRRFARTRVPAE